MTREEVRGEPGKADIVSGAWVLGGEGQAVVRGLGHAGLRKMASDGGMKWEQCYLIVLAVGHKGDWSPSTLTTQTI